MPMLKCPVCGKEFKRKIANIVPGSCCSVKCSFDPKRRFFKKVKIHPTGCWEWVGYKNPDGYGQMIWNGKPHTLAHRVSWEIHYGKFPEDHQTLHKCDNPGCVRPDHLFAGTPKDNVRDMIQKGRHKFMGWKGNAKLSEDDVREIRKIHKPGMAGFGCRTLSKQFGVNRSVITRILNRKSWVHVL